MRRPQWRGAAGAVTGGALISVLLALGVLGGPGWVPAAQAAVPAADDSLIMVLDSSGSMSGADGSGSTRIESARKAVNTVVDTLPDGHRTGLRVYGAGKPHGCDDTQLAEPVVPLDRDAMKKAVAAVQPKGDTPTALALTRAAGDLPKDGRRTILLISDGESNCGAPKPCDVAAQLAGDGIGLRIDTIGFQVRGAAREELECVAHAGHGAYYDAPDAAALARQLVRASQLSADAYRFEGTRVTGGTTAARAPGITPGQYLDTIGPGETRWYAAGLDATATADLAVTAVPQPGVKAGYGDGIELKAVSAGQYAYTCDTGSAHFGQDEGAMILTTAVSRVPTAKGDGSCDKAGQYLLSVHRTTAPGSDQGRWAIEIRYGSEAPLKAGTTPAAAETEYGEKPAPVAGDPRDITGGTGFNDAAALGRGVWRDKLLPAQTRFYKVRLGWGQQLSYAAEFANEPVLDDAAGSSAWSFVETATYGPARQPVSDASKGDDHRGYSGKPMSVGLGTVPVTWTNRWVTGGAAPAVHSAGDYYIAVSLGPRAAQLARNAAVGVVLRVNVTGDELAGPQYQAPALAKGKGGSKDSGKSDGGGGDSAAGRDSGGTDGGGFMTGTDMIAAGAGGAVALAAVGTVALVRRTKRGGA